MSRQTKIWISRTFLALCVTLGFIGGLQTKWSADAEAERLRVQLRVREQVEDAINGVLESEDYGLAIADEHGKIIEWNAALVKWTGWEKDEAVGMRIQDFIPMDYVDENGVPMRDRHAKAFPAAINEVREELKKPLAEREQRHLAVVRCKMPTKTGGSFKAVINVRVVDGRHGDIFASAHVDRPRNIVNAGQ